MSSLESWVGGDEHWKKSSVYISITNERGTINADARDWLTVAELEGKLGKEAAKSMINNLELNFPEKCRDHPDAKGIKDYIRCIDILEIFEF